MSQNKFTGGIGAWIDSELHPSNAPGPSAPNTNFTSMRLNNVYAGLSYLCIAWFDVDMTNPQQPTISTGNPGLAMIIADAKAQNPNIKFFATLAYSDTILDNLTTIINDPTLLASFAANIATYLGNNGMHGFDIDWEPPTSELSTAECKLWLTALGNAFGSTYYISLSPCTTDGLDVTSVNKYCSVINLQNYYAEDDPQFPVEFAQYGINPELLGFGAKFESRSPQDFTGFQDAFNAYQNFTAGFNYNGKQYSFNTICTWRMDSGNWPFEQGQQLLLSQYITGGPATVPFNDGAILNVQTTPTLMQSMTVWSGEVVDAIQTANAGQNGYTVSMLQHGGDTGGENPSLTFTNGLTQFTYVTGYWYGNFVIVQVSVQGQSFPAAISSSVSNTQTVNITAPAGKTIVAFSGTSQKVQLAGGGFTWVLSSLTPVFA